MNRIKIFGFLLLCCFAAKAEKHAYQLNVGVFDKLNVTDNVNVEYRCVADSAGYIAFEGEPEFADAFIFSNNKGKLRIQVNVEDVNNPNLPVLRVYSHYLSEVENGSDFTTVVENAMAVPSLGVKQIGNGKIIVRDVKANDINISLATGKGNIIVGGECGVVNIKMVGAGKIQCENLNSESVKCHILGSGEIYCNPIKLLEVKGIGSTKIFYKGAPELNKKGGGKLIPITDLPD